MYEKYAPVEEKSFDLFVVTKKEEENAMS